MLDLSRLEQTQEAAVQATMYGKPLELLLRDIEEDPNQPRREFDRESLQELTESIRLHGVKTPVSVRSHPTTSTKWMLNYGARRYRASRQAGKTTIPAFIDQQHTDYQQVIENRQRENLAPMELALFIQKKLGEGASQADVARSLSTHRMTITEHLALIHPPACIEHAYTSRACTSPRTLYDLRALHEKFPKEVEQWCEETADITRAEVVALSAKLKGTSQPKKQAKPVTRTQPQQEEEGPLASASTNGPLSASRSADVSERAAGRRGIEEPYQLIVSVDNRQAHVLFSHQPNDQDGLVIQFDNEEIREIPAKSCRIERLVF